MRLWTLMLVTATMLACQPYRPDFLQGTKLTQTQLHSLKTGMTKDEVLATLGAPPLTPVLTVNRWDYLYKYVPGNDSEDEGAKAEQQALTLQFKQGRLVSFKGV